MGVSKLTDQGKVLDLNVANGTTVTFDAATLETAGWSRVTQIIVTTGSHNLSAENKGVLLVRLKNRTTENLGNQLTLSVQKFTVELQSVADRLAEGGGFIVSYENTSAVPGIGNGNFDQIRILGD